jgi:hypothetical protein
MTQALLQRGRYTIDVHHNTFRPDPLTTTIPSSEQERNLELEGSPP